MTPVFVITHRKYTVYYCYYYILAIFRDNCHLLVVDLGQLSLSGKTQNPKTVYKVSERIHACTHKLNINVHIHVVQCVSGGVCISNVIPED